MLLCVVIALPGLKNLSFDSNYKVFVPSTNEYMRELEHIEQTYAAQEDSMVFVVTDKSSGSVMTKEGIGALRELTNRSLEIKYALEAESIVNFQSIETVEETITSRELVPSGKVLSPQDAEAVRMTALAQEALVGRLLSRDGKLALVVVTFVISGDRTAALLDIHRQADDLRNAVERSFPNSRILLSGLLMFDYSMVDASLKDATSILPPAGLFIVLVLWMIFRSIVCATMVVITVLVNVSLAYCAFGYLQYTVNVLTLSGTIMIATLSIADSIHLLSGFLRNVNLGQSGLKAMKQSLEVNLIPLFLTTVTTVVGFLALYFSPSPPVRQLGVFAALGVMADFLTTVFTLPALVLLVSQYRGLRRGATAFPTAVVRLATRTPRGAVLIGTVVCVFVGSFVFENRIDDNSLKWFDDSMEFRQAIDASQDKLEGFKTITFNIDSREDGGVLNPAFTGMVQSFTDWLHMQPELSHVRSYLDVLKEVKGVLDPTPGESTQLPATRAEAAQLLLMHELSLPSPRHANRFLSVDKREARIVLSLRNVSNTEYLQFERRARAWLSANAPDAGQIRGTSVPLMFAHITQENLIAMVHASIAVMFVIFVVLTIAFRSLTLIRATVSV